MSGGELFLPGELEINELRETHAGTRAFEKRPAAGLIGAPGPSRAAAVRPLDPHTYTGGNWMTTALVGPMARRKSIDTLSLESNNDWILPLFRYLYDDTNSHHFSALHQAPSDLGASDPSGIPVQYIQKMETVFGDTSIMNAAIKKQTDEVANENMIKEYLVSKESPPAKPAVFISKVISRMFTTNSEVINDYAIQLWLRTSNLEGVMDIPVIPMLINRDSTDHSKMLPRLLERIMDAGDFKMSFVRGKPRTFYAAIIDQLFSHVNDGAVKAAHGNNKRPLLIDDFYYYVPNLIVLRETFMDLNSPQRPMLRKLVEQLTTQISSDMAPADVFNRLRFLLWGFGIFETVPEEDLLLLENALIRATNATANYSPSMWAWHMVKFKSKFSKGEFTKHLMAIYAAQLMPLVTGWDGINLGNYISEEVGGPDDLKKRYLLSMFFSEFTPLEGGDGELKDTMNVPAVYRLTLRLRESGDYTIEHANHDYGYTVSMAGTIPHHQIVRELAKYRISLKDAPPPVPQPLPEPEPEPVDFTPTTAATLADIAPNIPPPPPLTTPMLVATMPGGSDDEDGDGGAWPSPSMKVANEEDNVENGTVVIEYTNSFYRGVSDEALPYLKRAAGDDDGTPIMTWEELQTKLLSMVNLVDSNPDALHIDDVWRFYEELIRRATVEHQLSPWSGGAGFPGRRFLALVLSMCISQQYDIAIKANPFIPRGLVKTWDTDANLSYVGTNIKLIFGQLDNILNRKEFINRMLAPVTFEIKILRANMAELIASMTTYIATQTTAFNPNMAFHIAETENMNSLIETVLLRKRKMTLWKIKGDAEYTLFPSPDYVKMISNVSLDELRDMFHKIYAILVYNYGFDVKEVNEDKMSDIEAYFFRNRTTAQIPVAKIGFGGSIATSWISNLGIKHNSRGTKNFPVPENLQRLSKQPWNHSVQTIEAIYAEYFKLIPQVEVAWKELHEKAVKLPEIQPLTLADGAVETNREGIPGIIVKNRMGDRQAFSSVYERKAKIGGIGDHYHRKRNAATATVAEAKNAIKILEDKKNELKKTLEVLNETRVASNLKLELLNAQDKTEKKNLLAAKKVYRKSATNEKLNVANLETVSQIEAANITVTTDTENIDNIKNELTEIANEIKAQQKKLEDATETRRSYMKLKERLAETSSSAASTEPEFKATPTRARVDTFDSNESTSARTKRHHANMHELLLADENEIDGNLPTIEFADLTTFIEHFYMTKYYRSDISDQARSELRNSIFYTQRGQLTVHPEMTQYVPKSPSIAITRQLGYEFVTNSPILTLDYKSLPLWEASRKDWSTESHGSGERRIRTAAAIAMHKYIFERRQRLDPSGSQVRQTIDPEIWGYTSSIAKGAKKKFSAKEIEAFKNMGTILPTILTNLTIIDNKLSLALSTIVASYKSASKGSKVRKQARSDFNKQKEGATEILAIVKNQFTKEIEVALFDASYKLANKVKQMIHSYSKTIELMSITSPKASIIAFGKIWSMIIK
jgi:hypothetical protein